jgi:hypothetical protein
LQGRLNDASRIVGVGWWNRSKANGAQEEAPTRGSQLSHMA